MSIVQNLLAPGGGVALIPFIRYVIMLLLVVTSIAFICGVARIHMAILSFLSAGLLVSLSVFQTEYKKMMDSREGGSGGKTGASAKSSGGKAPVKERAD